MSKPLRGNLAVSLIYVYFQFSCDSRGEKSYIDIQFHKTLQIHPIYWPKAFDTINV